VGSATRRAGTRSPAKAVGDTRRVAALVTAVVVAIVAIGAAYTVSNREPDERPAGQHGREDATGPPGPAGPRRALRRGIEVLQALPAVEVRYEATGTEGGSVKGQATLVGSSGGLMLRERTDLGGGLTLIEERRIRDGVLHLRAHPDDAVGPVPWDEVDDPAQVQSDLERVLTAKGRALPTLDRLVELAAALPYRAEEVRGGTRLRFEAVDIASHYADTGIETVEHPEDTTGTTTFVLRYGPRGLLAGMRASGTVFQDGEAIEGVDIRIRYTPTDPVMVDAPPRRARRG
jgi:hypothetical protein